ncbi:MAG TPA: GNAT family N-acetyltransferase [Flavisolibacter sp.]|nr:GNAT family N-acetyltransferase [Flavisolibacter sp.]
MGPQNTIRQLKQEEIDRQLWDKCISESENGLIYPTSIYLDHLADHWDGLVLNDYEAVMPLPWRKKFGLKYIYQPFLTAQLGVFGKKVDAPLVAEFFNAIPAQFRLIEFSLNYGNLFPLTQLNLYIRTNFVLDLRPSYETLRDRYRENVQRNIEKSAKYGCFISNDVAIESVIELAKRQDDKSSGKDFASFAKLYGELKTRGAAVCYGVRTSKGELIASAAFLFSPERAYYLLVGNHPNGRTLGASHALIDAFIRDHAGRNLVLDFEGSDIRNVAFFYSGFGAKEELYPAIKLNRLPALLRWLK